MQFTIALKAAAVSGLHLGTSKPGRFIGVCFQCLFRFQRGQGVSAFIGGRVFFVGGFLKTFPRWFSGRKVGTGDR